MMSILRLASSLLGMETEAARHTPAELGFSRTRWSRRHEWRTAPLRSGDGSERIWTIGRQIVRALSQEISGTVTIAGRQLEAAQAAMKDIAGQVPSGIDLEAKTLDGEDADALAATLAKDNAFIHCAALAGAAGEALLNALLQTGGRAVLLTHDRGSRARLEQLMGKLKRFKRIVRPCEEVARNFRSIVPLATAFILVESVHNA